MSENYREGTMMYSLGIDLGSASVTLALLDENKRVVFTGYRLHKGDVPGTLSALLEEVVPEFSDVKICLIGVCGIHRDMIQAPPVNEITALITGARHVAPGASSIMEIGGQSAKYITGIRGGNVRFMLNDNCSAGTGSFFETQTARLGIELDAYSDLADKAVSIPRIAGRCSVFSKTDIIHLQQDGEKIENILNGLCYAAVRNYKASVAGKLPLELPVAFAGGTVFNRGVLRALKDVFGLADGDLIISDYTPYIAAIGAALNTAESNSTPIHIHDLRMEIENKRAAEAKIREEDDNTPLPPLYPLYTDWIGLHTVHAVNPGEPCVLGIDIGSTSTNFVLIDNSGNVIDYQYLRTKGNPVEAVRKGFKSILERLGGSILITAAATTGSGRHLIGRLIGADMVYDEITAQAASAAHFVPDVDTVFEIGGQDSKYISIKNGLVRDFQMNKICAAGTGSFIEEQAGKLNIPLDHYGETALSAKKPCNLGERCTVFIESNINACLSKGAGKENIAAGLCYSVLSNYLNRVVGNKPIGNRILLQGGVAYNPAIVAAFNEKFGSRLEVAPWFSVSGAVGAALLAKNAITNNKTAFKGLLCLEEDYAENTEEIAPEVKTSTQKNQASGSLVPGYNPERDPGKKTIGIPRALIIHSWFPIFKGFFQALGFNVIISPETDGEIIEYAQLYTKSEMCYPVKLAIGHTAYLASCGVDYIFFPSLHSLMSYNKKHNNYTCVYMKKAPRILENSVGLKNKGIILLTCDLEFHKGMLQPFKALYRLGRQLTFNPATCFNALLKGIKAMMGYIKEHEKAVHGNNSNDKFNADKPAFVMVARGYCQVDPALNLGIRDMLVERGYKLLNLHHYRINIYKQYPNIYWSFGVFALAAAKEIASRNELYAIHPTYHGCGPDGVLSHWFEDEMGDKPYLDIEIDEHASKVGVITRLEAFTNSARIHQKSISEQEQPMADIGGAAGFYNSITKLCRKNPVIIPYLYPYSTLLTVYLQGKGYIAEELPPTSPESLAKGRSFMRGKEYFSLTSLLGDTALYSEYNQAAQLLFPQTQGSEADGLYSYFVYSKLKDKIAVVSPVLERLPNHSLLSEAVFRILLAGDIALHINQGSLFQSMKTIFANELPDDKTLLQWAQTSRETCKCILFIGEPWCMHNNLFQSIIVRQIQAAGLHAAFAPFSEMLLFDWYRQKRSRIVKRFEKLMYNVSHALGENSVFSGSLDHLNGRTFDGVLNDGFLNYRNAKASMYNERILGIISVSSQHENTESVLELLSFEKKLPFLNLRFDGESNPVNHLKVDSFLDGIIKRQH